MDAVQAGELAPRQRVVAPGPDPVAHHRDRALGAGIGEDECPPLRLGTPRHLDAHSQGRELPVGAVAELVVPQGGEEPATPRQARQLHGGHGAAASWLLPGVEGVDDLAGGRHARDARELDPFHVPDDRDLHGVVAAHAVTAAGAASRPGPPSSSPGDEPGRRYRRSTMMPPIPESIVSVFTEFVSTTWNVCAWKKSGTYIEWRNRSSIMTRAKNANAYRDTRHRQRSASTGNTHAANQGAVYTDPNM